MATKTTTVEKDDVSNGQAVAWVQRNTEDEKTQYRWFCLVCGECEDWHEYSVKVDEGRGTHIRNNSCGLHDVSIQSRDNEPPAQEMQTVLDPAEVDQDHFEIPIDLGYRLAGWDEGTTRALVGPGGRIITDWYSEIEVIELGKAIVKDGFHDEEIRWQPDLREVDAWDRRPDAISGYGLDGKPLPTEDAPNIGGC